MNQHPISAHRQVVLQKAKVNFPANPDDVDHGRVRLIGKKLDDLPWNR
jgi:hypothetical protein